MNDTKDCLMNILIELEGIKAYWGTTFTAEGIQIAINIVEKHLEEQQ